MAQERDLLVKRVIPKLRKLCMERDVLLTYVDLRWSVSPPSPSSFLCGLCTCFCVCARIRARRGVMSRYLFSC
jgi:hypothetical protein